MSLRALLALLFALAAFVSATHAEAAAEDPTSNDAADGAPAPNASEKPATSAHQGVVGAQAFWAAGKVMPGLVVRFDLHPFFLLDVEGGLVFVTDPPPGSDAFVGSPFGTHVLVAPFRTPGVELAAGLGVDVHYLWGINPDIAEVAMSVIASGHYWVTPHLGVFGSARWYPIATSGLDLGEFRDGSAGLPVLFATGVAWSFP